MTIKITTLVSLIASLAGIAGFITVLLTKRHITINWVSPNKKDYTDISSIKR